MFELWFVRFYATVWVLRDANFRCFWVTIQGRTQEGADGAKAPPPKFPYKNYLLIQFQIRSILCFAVCTKKSVSVSQSFYNNRSYRLRCWTAEAGPGHKMRCRVINACYLFITCNLVSGSGTGARNTLTSSFSQLKMHQISLGGRAPDPPGDLTALPQTP